MTQHLQFEAKKDGLKQTQDGTIKLTLSVHPQDSDINRLFAAPMGKVYQVVLVDQEAIKAPDKPKDTLTQQAAIMSNEPAFYQFIEHKYGKGHFGNGAQAIRSLCQVKSRSDIKSGTEAATAFMALKSDYNYWIQYG